MAYRHTKIFILIVFITFNSAFPAYGNSPEECSNCVGECFNKHLGNILKNKPHERELLDQCNKGCDSDHCFNVGFRYEVFVFEETSCINCLSKCCEDPNGTLEVCSSKTCKDCDGKAFKFEDFNKDLKDIKCGGGDGVQNGPGPNGKGQNGPGPNGKGQNGPGPNGKGQNGPGPNGKVPAQPSPTEGPLGPIPPFPPAGVQTCTIPNDLVCFPSGSTPITTIFSQEGVITPTPIPANAKSTTIQSTSTLYVAGYQTTDSLGQPTFIPPSTLYVVKNIAVTEPAAATTTVSDSTTILHDFSSHGFWGVTISFVIATTTLIFMVFA
ncbi:hypothetical protein C1645_733301 [Glomus cerebriforme]|uniref:Mid2 domain-containing protein n=1 Tax=Glomus cerebriforme TaxID=658196 RepID=A0A397TGD2_9GLOM|nr:hypothetical protein C1645_733301 [Glomus cerebriforme]